MITRPVRSELQARGRRAHIWERMLLLVMLMVLAPMAGLVSADRPEERVVFTAACDSGPDGALWFAEPISAATPTSPETYVFHGVAVSPDGARLAVTRYDGIEIAKADGSSGELVTESSITQTRSPAWSPAGDRVAFVGLTSGTSRILVTDLDTRITSSLPNDSQSLDRLDWSADGMWLLRSGDGLIGTVNLADGAFHPIGEGLDARYSPDGTRIAFVTGDGRLATMSADGGDVWTSNQTGRVPVWSPDGGSLAFVDRHWVDGYWASYIGVLSLEDGGVSVVTEGTVVCDDVFITWDWAVLQWPTFADVPFDHPFHDEVDWAWNSGLTKGCNPPVSDRFCPLESVTRGQMATFLNRALSLPVAPDQGLVDTAGSVFAADIDALYAAGITKGCNPPVSDRFCPDESVTRGQLAAFLNRALGLPVAPDQGLVDTAGSVFAADINALYAAGITKGCNPPVNDRFCPDEPVTRGQMAAFLQRALP